MLNECLNSLISSSYNDLGVFLSGQQKINANQKQYSGVFSTKKVHGITHLILNKTTERGTLNLNTKSTYEQFLELLWKCYLDNIGDMSWFERQYYAVENSPDVIASGLMIDFDIYQTSPDRSFPCHYNGLVSTINNILAECVDFGKEIVTTYAVIIEKPELTELENNMYKDGAHILYPGLHMTKEAKMFIIRKLSEKYTPMFVNMGYKKCDDAIDLNSSSVPVQMYGNCRTGKVPHVFKKLFKVVFNPIGEQVPELRDVTELFKYVKRVKKTAPIYKYNLCRELSLHLPGKLIKNHPVCIKSKFEKDLISICTTISRRMLERDDKQIDAQLQQLISEDVDAYELSRYVNILKKERGVKYNNWYSVCQLIAEVNTSYQVIAYNFSIACSVEKWNNGARKLIDKIFADTAAKKRQPNYDAHNALRRAFGIIIMMAQNDNPAQYKLIHNNSLFEKIRRLAFKSSGNLNDTQLAIIVKIICNGNYVFCPHQMPGFKNSGKWYEFITKSKAGEPGNELYIGRWKERSSFPVSLDTIISIEIGKYIDRIARWISAKSEEEVDNKAKHMKKMATNMRNRAQQCGNARAINNIKSRCMDNIFNYEGFETKLNIKNNLLGVANGVLKITNDNAELIECANEYYVSRTCKTWYKPYDESDEIIQETNKIINTILPNKRDRDVIMMWIGTALVFRNKRVREDLVFLILYSGGGSGKTVLCDLIQNALGTIGTLGYDDTFGHTYPTSNAFFTTEKRDPNSADNHLSNFRYARVVICPEGKGGWLNFTRIKQFSDAISARGLYEKNKTMNIGAHAIYPTNEEPILKRIDYSVERRLIYYRMPMKFIKETPTNDDPYVAKRDPTIDEKVHKSEYGSAFLSILVHYYHRLHKEYDGDIINVLNGSGVQKQTRAYIARNDGVSQFIEQRLVKDANNVLPIDVVAREYVDWYGKTKDKTAKLIANEFYTDFREHSKLRKHVYETSTNIVIKGWRIMSEIEYADKQTGKKTGTGNVNAANNINVVTENNNIDTKVAIENNNKIINTENNNKIINIENNNKIINTENNNKIINTENNNKIINTKNNNKIINTENNNKIINTKNNNKIINTKNNNKIINTKNNNKVAVNNVTIGNDSADNIRQDIDNGVSSDEWGSDNDE